METHINLSDQEFIHLFETCALDPASFTHEAHLRLAWLEINQYGLEQAIQNIQRYLKKYVAHVGATDKYHTTITIAAIKMVYHFMQKSGADSFQVFIREYPQLKNNFKGLIEQHYSFNIFESVPARLEYILPDIAPFD